jgi:hypothetical protein
LAESKADAYVDLVAEKIVDLEETVDAKRDAVGARYVELLNDPAQRNEGIWEWFLGYMQQLMETETGNAVLAEDYWQEIDHFFDDSWEQLHRVPPPERGDIWHTGRKMISAVAAQQAFIESGLASDVLEHATETAAVVGKEAAKLTPAQKQEAAKETAIKAKAKDKREARKAAKDE